MKNMAKMFRVFAIVLAILVCTCMLFTSCTGDEDSTGSSSTTESSSPATDSSASASVPGSDESDPSTDASVPGSDVTDPSTDDSKPGSDVTDPSTDDSKPGTEDEPCTEHTGGTATCTAKAQCEKCGEEYGEFADHTEGTPATCTEAAICSVCNESYGEPNGHSLEAGEVVAPTCEAEGYTVYGCDICGYTENKDTVEALGGTCDWYFTKYSDEDRPACGVKGGTEIYTCLVCAATKEVAQEAMHDLSCKMNVVEGKEPTCTEAGYAWYECMSCSEGVERKIPAEHTYDAPTDFVAATCTTDGSQKWQCTLCEYNYVEVLESNGHNQMWQYDSTTATCTEAGVEIYGCYNCSEKIEVEVEAYGHDWIVDEESLDLEAHTISSTCDTCGATESFSSLGMQQDPIVITIPGEINFEASEEWVYYTFAHTEGYLTLTFTDTTYNALVKDTGFKYDQQFAWGGEATWTAEIMADGTYVLAISGNANTVSVAFEEADVPAAGETSDKAILIEYDNTAYTSTGKVWYVFENAPAGATISFTIEGTATVYYGVDPESLVEYTEGFVEELGYTKYYIVVESTEEATIVVNLEFPLGSMDNPFAIVAGENNIEYVGGFYNTYYAVYNSMVNGTLTLTYDAANNAQVVIVYGSHPYMLFTSIEGGSVTIDVTASEPIYFGITTQDWSAANFTITASFEEASVEPVGPENEIGEVINSMEVETTDTYSWIDEYTFTATEAGKYTFYVPAGLGLWSAAEMEANPYGSPAIDYYANEAGYFVSVDLEAGEAYTFIIGAISKDTWTIDVYYYVEQAPVVEYNDEFNGTYVDNNQAPSLIFVFADGTLVIEDNSGFFNIGGTYEYGYNAELGEFSINSDAFTLNVSSETLFLNGRVPLVEFAEPTVEAVVLGNNSLTFVNENYYYGETKVTFVAEVAGTYVFAAAEGEENFVMLIEDEYGVEMVDVPYEIELAEGESFEFIVSTGANVLTTTEDTVDFVISIKE